MEILRKPKSLFSGESGRELEEGLPKAIEILERTKKELYREDRTKKLMNNRTNWIKKLVSEERQHSIHSSCLQRQWLIFAITIQ